MATETEPAVPRSERRRLGIEARAPARSACIARAARPGTRRGGTPWPAARRAAGARSAAGSERPSPPCRHAGRCGRRPARRCAPPSRPRRWRAGRGPPRPGPAGPTSGARRRSSSPSPSPRCSVTMAPCRSRNTRIDRQRRAQVVDQPADDPLEGVLGDAAARARRWPRPAGPARARRPAPHRRSR